MRLRILWASEGSVVVPWNYPHLLHGFLYAAIRRANPQWGEFLHQQGFVVGSHRYKLLTFSLLFPRSARRRKEGLEMSPPIQWWVSSPLHASMEALASTLLKEGVAQLGKVEFMVERVEVEETPQFSGCGLFETLSPIVASTGMLKGERLEHRFLSPEEPEFWILLERNLRRKAQALGEEVSPEPLRLEAMGKWRSRLFEVQGTKVRGYEGRFWAEGDGRLLWVGYEAGWGERNAQGWGMVRLVTSG